jgi:general secretion pathway protein G
MNTRIRRISTRKSRSGFTLIEIMLVLVILAAVAGIAVFALGGTQATAFKKTSAAQINSLKTMLDMYKLNMGTYPPTLDALNVAPSDADPARWEQVSRDPIKPDPWGRPFEYKVEGDKYDLRSLGADGQSGSEDDITG